MTQLRWVVHIVGWVSVCGLTSSATAQWTPPYWQLHRIGLTDAEHTSADGLQFSGFPSLGASGQVIGQSSRYQGSSTAGFSAWAWTEVLGTTRIGFFDAQHTSTGAIARQQSRPLGQNSSGEVIGTSDRYLGFTVVGTSAWTWTPSLGTVSLGLVDSQHTHAAGYHSSTPEEVNSTGQIVGYSNRYDGFSSRGRSAWSWTNVLGTTRIGLVDSQHTQSNGFQNSRASAINSAGQVIGYSTRYQGSTESGQSAWSWTNAIGTVRLGFTDDAHTRSDGVQWSRAIAANDAGQVIGESQRFTGLLNAGASAWAWTHSLGTTRIGFTDAQHTTADGYQYSQATAQNAAGQIIGTSSRSDNGSSAWTWTSSLGTVRIGLVDAQHTRGDGLQSSYSQAINPSGRVLGTSARYLGGSDSGSSAWTWSSSSGTTRIGLTDAQHTRTDGYQQSSASAINTSGHVLGSSSRYTGGVDGGASAWTWSSSLGTVRLGLVDSLHTRADGYQFSSGRAMDETGQVIGTSLRYAGLSDLGTSGWFYDPSTNVTTPLIFSISSTGMATTTPNILTDSGWVLGSYTVFDGASAASENIFLWSIANGFTDLGQLVEGGLTAQGWSSLSSVVGANEFQAIAGSGDLLGGNHAVYVMTVPSPGAAALGIGALVFARRRRDGRGDSSTRGTTTIADNIAVGEQARVS